MSAYPKVNYFGTCLADMAFAEAGLAGVRLLKKAGVDEVIFPKNQSCCGQPAYNSGFTKEAYDVACAQIKAFSHNSYPIVVPSGSCAGMMKTHYPELFLGTPMEAQAQEFSARVFELSAFLAEECGVIYEDKGEPIVITWHSSCHAQRETKCIEASKALIRQLKYVTLIELEREYECCGFGGTFSVKMPELSLAMVKEKITDIESKGVDMVISGDAGCLLNIGTAMEFQKTPIKAQHIAEFLWERVYA